MAEPESNQVMRVRFICDAMFGTLAKWLRVTGFDTVYANEMEDGDITALADKERRVLITRDRDLAARTPESFYLDNHELEGQIMEVLARYPADRGLMLTRCLLCNTLLESVPKKEVKGIPEGVLERETEFQKCPKCDKFFWPATHYENMVRRIRELTREPGNNPR